MDTEELQYYKGINTIEGLRDHFKTFENRIAFFDEIADFSESVISTDRKYTPNDATILGLMVKMHKLYQICFNAYSNLRGEEITLLNRVMYESHITMLYLIKNGIDIQKKYRLVGYCNHYKLLNERTLTNEIEFGIRQVYDYRLSCDGFTISDLKEEFSKNSNGKLHKNGFHGVFKDVNNEEFYSHYNIFFGFGSDSSHPNWYDSLNYDIEYQDGFYIPKFGSKSEDGFNGILMIAAFLLDSLMDFQEYFRIETTVDARKYYSVIFGLTPKKKDEILFIPSELIEKVEII